MTGFYCQNKNLSLICSNLLADNLLLFQNFNGVYILNKVHVPILNFFGLFFDSSKKFIVFYLNFLIRIKNISSPSISRYCFPILNKLFECKINYSDEEIRPLFINFLVSLLDENTTTIQILAHENLHIFKLLKFYSYECRLLLPYISLCGMNSIYSIIELSNIGIFADPLSSIEYYHRIPIHFKLQKTFEIMSQIEIIMKSKQPSLIFYNKRINNIATAFFLIYELMQAGKQAKELNKLGKCYKNPLEYRAVPLMIKCKRCNSLFCIPCGQSHENLKHEICYLSNKKLDNFGCSGNLENRELAHFTQKITPNYEVFVIENQEKKDGFFVFYSKVINFPSFCEDSVVYYTEIFFERIYNENIFIELEGCGIVYNNITSQCLIYDEILGNMPRIGRYDTVGIGITSDSYVFFTFNGFNLLKYIKFNARQAQIVIKINDFKEPSIVSPLQSLYIGDQLNFLEKEFLINYPEIIKFFVLLEKFKNEINKSLSPGKENLFDVLLDIKAMYPRDVYEKILKNMQKNKVSGDCKPF